MDPIKETSFIIAIKTPDSSGEKVWESNPNPQITRSHANAFAHPKCKVCCGKGYIIYSPINGLEYEKFCNCAIKNLRTFTQELTG